MQNIRLDFDLFVYAAKNDTTIRHRNIGYTRLKKSGRPNNMRGHIAAALTPWSYPFRWISDNNAESLSLTASLILLSSGSDNSSTFLPNGLMLYETPLSSCTFLSTTKKFANFSS